jgi:uncharacterized protein YcbX
MQLGAPVGQVEAIFRYPVKSMRGEALESASLGWHGLEGDRRFALRRLEDRSGFPWLTAGKFAELLCYSPLGENASPQPTHVRIPEGNVLPIWSEELAEEINRRYGSPVQMARMKDGIFDDASISVIASETVNEIGRLAGLPADPRRFRPNVVVRLASPAAFQEDAWLSGVLTFGEGDEAPAIAVTRRDIRCAMINLDPDTAESAPQVLKAVVWANDNTAGVYATVTRVGQLSVGQTIFLHRSIGNGA